MGRSMRSFKKDKPKVRVGVQKKRKIVKPEPVVIPGTSDKIEWCGKSTVVANFQTTGLLLDPNRLRVSDEPMEAADDVRSALGQKRKDGKQAPVQRLTTMQRVYMTRLIDKHSDDFEAMSRDVKLNRMQHAPGALKKLCARFHAYENLVRDSQINQAT